MVKSARVRPSGNNAL